MDFEIVWKTLTSYTMITTGIVIGISTISQIIYSIGRWIDDFEKEKSTLLLNNIAKSHEYFNDSVGEFMAFLAIVTFLGIIGSIIWFVSIPGVIITVFIFMLRSLVRFKKKVNLALKINEGK